MKISVGYLYEMNEKKYTDILSSVPSPLKEKIDGKKFNEEKYLSCLGYHFALADSSEILNISPKKIECEILKGGRPMIKNNSVFFSISHSKDIVISAVDNENIGIDIEKTRPVNLRLIKKVCNGKEAEFVLGRKPVFSDYTITKDEEIINRFFLVWTAKEAYFKFLSTGIDDFKSADYFSILKNIKTLDINGYIASVYSENQSD